MSLAHDCKHPDAVWLTLIFEGKVVSTKEDAERGFSFFRERCFVWWFSDGLKDLSLRRRACEMVGTFACSMLSLECGSKEEAFRLAELVASQHERDSFYLLGWFLRDGCGCERDLNLAKENS